MWSHWSLSDRMTYSTMSPTLKSCQKGVSCNVGKNHIHDMECNKRQNGEKCGLVQSSLQYPGGHLGEVITEHPWERE